MQATLRLHTLPLPLPLSSGTSKPRPMQQVGSWRPQVRSLLAAVGCLQQVSTQPLPRRLGLTRVGKMLTRTPKICRVPEQVAALLQREVPQVTPRESRPVRWVSGPSAQRLMGLRTCSLSQTTVRHLGSHSRTPCLG